MADGTYVLLNVLNAVFNFSGFVLSVLIRKKFADTPYSNLFLPMAIAFLIAAAFRTSAVAFPEETEITGFLRLFASASFTLFSFTAFNILCRGKGG